MIAEAKKATNDTLEAAADAVSGARSTFPLISIAACVVNTQPNAY